MFLSRKPLIALLLAMLMLLACACALAATEPLSRVLEETVAYEDAGIRVSVDRWCYTYERDGSYKSHTLRFFVAHVEVDDPAQLQTAFAGEEYSPRNTEATFDIAVRHDAVIAVNGDYYNFKNDNGLIIRNGVLYRDKKSSRDQLLVYADGSLVSLPKGTFTPGSGEAYVADGVVQSFSFGPLLIDGGEILALSGKNPVTTRDDAREPRTAIGWVDATHYVLLVADGRRKDWSENGMTLQEMQQVFSQEGCQIAYNLDGGGSATMVLNGELLNHPSGSGQRDVSDIIYFVTP